jgi:hypothetical protein
VYADFGEVFFRAIFWCGLHFVFREIIFRAPFESFYHSKLSPKTRNFSKLKNFNQDSSNLTNIIMRFLQNQFSLFYAHFVHMPAPSTLNIRQCMLSQKTASSWHVDFVVHMQVHVLTYIAFYIMSLSISFSHSLAPSAEL